jgi:hypothetical protein
MINAPADLGELSRGAAASCQPDVPAAPGESGSSAIISAQQRLFCAAALGQDRGSILTIVVAEAVAILRARAATLCELAPGAEVLVVRASAGQGAGRVGDHLPVEGSVEGSCITEGRVFEVADLAGDPRTYLGTERGLGSAPALVIPLLSGTGSRGALLVLLDATHPQPAEDLVRAVGSFAACALLVGASTPVVPATESRLASWRNERALMERLEWHERADAAQGRVAFEWDVARDRFRWSLALESVLAHSAHTFAPTLDAWLQEVHTEDQRAARAMIGRVQAGVRARGLIRLRHRSGHFRRFDVSLEPAGPAGKPAVGILQEQGREGDDRAREIAHALRHEINNPLTTIVGRVQLLLRNGGSVAEDQLTEVLAEIRRETLRIQAATDRLAAFETPDPSPVHPPENEIEAV